jgi:ABC-2 type transport system permease protein
VRSWIDAMWGIVHRDAVVFVTYRTQLVSQVLGPLFSIAIFYYISHMLKVQTFHSPGGYFGYVIVGLVIVEILTLSLGLMPISVRGELMSGTIERFLVSAHGPVGGILGTMLFPLFNAFASGVLTLVLAAVVFGLPLATTSLLALPVALLGVVAFMPFALFLVAVVVAFKQVAGASQFIVSGIAIIGGLYFPIALLPGWIAWASEVQPFTPATDLMRHLLVDTPLAHPAWIEVLKLLGFASVLLPAAFMLLRAAIRSGQRSGTIAEY